MAKQTHSSVTNTIKKQNVIYKQSVSMTSEKNNLFEISAGDRSIAKLSKSAGNLIFNFDEKAFELLNFGDDFYQSGLPSSLQNPLTISEDVGAVSIFQKANEEVVFSVKSADKKPIIVKVGALGITIEHDEKTYTSTLSADKLGTSQDRATNNFTLSTEFFENLIDTTFDRVENVSATKIPSFLWGEYFTLSQSKKITESNQDFSVVKPEDGDPQLISYNLNGTKYCFVKNKNVPYIYHNGSLKKIQKTSLFVSNNTPFILVETGKKSLPVRLELPKDENQFRKFITSFENYFGDISSPSTKAQSEGMVETVYGLLAEKKDSTASEKYTFDLRPKNITLKESKSQTSTAFEKDKTPKAASRLSENLIKQPSEQENDLKSQEKPQAAAAAQKSQTKSENAKAQTPSEKSQEGTVKITIPGGKKKLDTSFLGETAMPLLAGFSLFASAITGFAPLLIVGLIAMVTSAVLISINSVEFSRSARKIALKLKSNKYTQFREIDKEYSKALEKTNENFTEMQSLIQNSSTNDFTSKFLDYYGQYGVAPESVNLAQRYQQTLQQRPNAEDFEKFAEIEMASTWQDRQRLFNEYLASKPEGDRAKLEQILSQPAFFDQDHGNEQHLAATQLQNWINQAELVESLKAQNVSSKEFSAARNDLDRIETSVVNRLFPNLDERIKMEFAEDFQTNTSENISTKVDSLIDKHFGFVNDAQKNKLKTEFAQTAARENKSKNLGKGISLNNFVEKNLPLLRQNKVQQIKQNLFRDQSGKADIKAVKQFAQSCTKSYAATAQLQSAHEKVQNFIFSNKNSAVQSLFSYESSKDRQIDLLSKYGDLFAQKCLYQSDSQLLMDRLTGSMHKDIQALAEANFKYQSAKIDKQMAATHKEIFKAEEKLENLDKIESFAQIQQKATSLNSSQLANNFSTLTDKLYDAMLFGDCENLSKDQNSLQNTLQNLANLSSNADKTLNDLRSGIIPNNLSKEYLNLHKTIKDSKIMQEILTAYISPKDSNNIYLSENSFAKYSKGYCSIETFGKLAGYNNSTHKTNFADVIEKHIKEAFIGQYIKFYNDKTQEQDHDKLVANEKRLKKELSSMQTDELINKITIDYPNTEDFYNDNPRLKDYKKLLDAQVTFNKTLEQNISYENLGDLIGIQHSKNSSSAIVGQAEGKKFEKIATFNKNGKVTIINEKLEALINEYDQKNGGAFTTRLENLSQKEQSALLKLVYEEIASVQDAEKFAKSGNVTLSSYNLQRAGLIRKLYESKLGGTLQNKIEAELTKQNLDKLVINQENKDFAMEAIKDYKKFGDQTSLNAYSNLVQNRFINEDLGLNQQIIDLISQLPAGARLQVVRKMDEKAPSSKLNDAKYLQQSLQEIALSAQIENKSLAQQIQLRTRAINANIAAKLNYTPTSADLELLSQAIKSDKDKIKLLANRDFVVRAQTLSAQVVEAEVKKGARNAETNLEEQELSKQDAKYGAQEKAKMQIQQVQDKFFKIIENIKVDFGNGPALAYNNFSESLSKIMEGDDKTLDKFGVRKADLEEIYDVLQNSNLNNVSKLLSKYSKQYRKMKGKIVPGSEADRKFNSNLKNMWSKVENQIKFAFEDKLKQSQQKIDLNKDKTQKKEKLEKRKNGRKIRKSARFYFSRKNKPKANKIVEPEIAPAEIENTAQQEQDDEKIS